MAKESSAINELIAVMAARPVARESSDELLFQAPRAALRPRPRPAMRVKPAPTVRPMPVLAGGTARPARSSRAWLAIPASVLGVVVLLGAGYLALRGDPERPKTTRVVAPAAAVVAAPQPVVAPIVTPPPKPKTTTVRIESTPPGATVTAGGAFVGTTPIDAALDPARSVELVLTLDGHARAVRMIDPASTTHVEVALDPDAVSSVAPPPAAPPKHHAHHHHATGKKHHSATMHARS